MKYSPCVLNSLQNLFRQGMAAQLVSHLVQRKSNSYEDPERELTYRGLLQSNQWGPHFCCKATSWTAHNHKPGHHSRKHVQHHIRLILDFHREGKRRSFEDHWPDTLYNVRQVFHILAPRIYRLWYHCLVIKWRRMRAALWSLKDTSMSPGGNYVFIHINFWTSFWFDAKLSEFCTELLQSF